MSYRYSFEHLLALLHGRAPAKVDAVALHRRRVEHGHLSVGLKIHCLGDGSQFSTLVEGLGGAQKILDVNYYKHSHASLCLVLPPVGSARSAILLLECIEHFIGSELFSNPEIQIQVCSPGRLGARRSALLAIGFYLGSDTLRRYTLGDLATSFAEHQHYPRGRRLVLYDAKGDFDRGQRRRGPGHPRSTTAGRHQSNLVGLRSCGIAAAAITLLANSAACSKIPYAMEQGTNRLGVIVVVL